VSIARPAAPASRDGDPPRSLLAVGGFPPATQAIHVDDPASVRAFLESDPVENAFAWHWAFQQRGRDLYVDRIPPPTILTESHANPPITFRFSVLAGADRESARIVLQAARPGEAFLMLQNPELIDVVRARANAVAIRPAWLYRLDRENFRDVQAHDVRPIPASWAAKIANLWEPEWDAVPYVRSRLEAGPAVGIYDGDELVAWYATHISTDRVAVMGFLHVLDKYRHRGYARSLSCALSKEIFRQGKIPACHVYEENTPSLALMDSLGLTRIKRQAFVQASFY